MSKEFEATEGQTGGAGEVSALDQLVEMTATEDADVEITKAAFDSLIEHFKSMPKGSTLTAAMFDDVLAKLDEKLSAQVGAIMKSKQFKEVESSWRGLAFLAQRTDYSKNIRIGVMQASKADLLDDLRQADTLDQSHFFKQVYTNEYDMPGGNPFGAIVGSFKFDSGALDMETLSRLSDVAKAAHAPLISSIAPEFFKVKDWREYDKISDLPAYLDGASFAEWKSFREKDTSKYVGLTFPGFLLRQPYGPEGEKASFDFRERAQEHDDYLWGNAAFTYASQIHKSFADSGWVVTISGGKNSGGLVEDLKVVEYNLGAEIAKISGEKLIADGQEKVISEAGFLPLSPYKNEAIACFFGCQSAKKPETYDSDDATSNAKMETMLAYMFPISRVTHYLKKMQRDNIGRFTTAQELEEHLDKWLHKYHSKTKGQQVGAEKPFTDYGVKVTEDPSNPGWFDMDVWVVPRIVLQGISGKLHLVTKIPAKKS